MPASLSAPFLLSRVMCHQGMTLRPVQPADNSSLEKIIISVLKEYDCVGEGYACNDPETLCMSDAYDGETSQYWVVESKACDLGSEVLGGGGFSRLKGAEAFDDIAELQKLYFSPQLRGLGLGKQVILLAIEGAKAAGYRQLYAETVPQMTHAIALYEQLGFQRIETPLGNTGHADRCTVRYLLPL